MAGIEPAMTERESWNHLRPKVTKQRQLRTILAPSAVAAQALP